MAIANEAHFESFLVNHLVKNENYILRTNEDYDRKEAIIVEDFIGYLKDTQLESYKALVEATGSEQYAKNSILARLRSELAAVGTLGVLRNKEFEAGFGVRFQMMGIIPASNLAGEALNLYNKNRISVIRQLKYSVRSESANNAIDVAIFINGLPIVTIELKNQQTGQTYMNAIKQYMKDRRADSEPLLQFKRCLVHFAMGTEQVYMTTNLRGEKTRFFPFNKTYQNEGVESENYRTSYMWTEILRRDSVFDLVQNFINVQLNKEQVYDSRTKGFKEVSSEALIFPRWHQRRAVHKVVADVVERGVGHPYLIKHSAGSGKSNTIAWLAYRLANLYRNPEDQHKIFDSVIVVTDRRVLDRQLQDTLRQFDQAGQLVCIDARKNMRSEDLKNAIEGRKNIIVTTLQKFSVIESSIQHFPNRKYAVIVDEAHSSQSGESSRSVRSTLSADDQAYFDQRLVEGLESGNEVQDYIDDATEMYDRIRLVAKRKGNRSNISFFAFTATPKEKTLHLFCEKDENDQWRPFDEYTMEQAIKEGFILNVLENYTTYNRYYKLVHLKNAEDKEYESNKAKRLLAEYVDLTEGAIEKKTSVILNHFMNVTSKEIQGRARAMVVTRSIMHVIRYKREFDRQMAALNLPYRALCAFTGSKHDPLTDMDYTETSMNNLQGVTDIALAFKLPQYRILIVAEKYQTGFDEPLLHTMYVDKKLGGTSTVQTLSRLNRTCSGKDSTAVIDFVNDPEEVRADFQLYYGKNHLDLEDATDPNSLYDLKTRIRQYLAFEQTDVDEFAKIYFSPKADNSKLYAVLDRVADAIRQNLEPKKMEEFRKVAGQFVRLYRYLNQVINFIDPELEKLYVFLAALTKQIVGEREQLPFEVLEEAQLHSYKLQYQYEQSLELQSDSDEGLVGINPGEVNEPAAPYMDYLSNIIRILNDAYGLDLTDDDRVDLELLRGRLASNKELVGFFNPDNSRENIQRKFYEEVDNELLDMINSRLDLYNKLSTGRANERVKKLLFEQLYDKFMAANY